MVPLIIPLACAFTEVLGPCLDAADLLADFAGGLAVCSASAFTSDAQRPEAATGSNRRRAASIVRVQGQQIGSDPAMVLISSTNDPRCGLRLRNLADAIVGLAA